jgi:hypothetical protein
MTTDRPFVPEGFTVPRELLAPRFRLEPLGPEHNEADLAAWTSSIEHIRATPGFAGRDWPPATGMTPEANLADLRGHAQDFARRSGFTYTVIEPDGGDVIGCVYIYPARGADFDTVVRCWVRADRAELDHPLYEAVAHWLAADWPLGRIDFPGRPHPSGRS